MRVPTRTKLGPRYSEGSRLLQAAIKSRFGSVSRASRKTGIATSSLVLWGFGDRSPGLEGAVALRDHFGVPVDAWLQPAASEVAA